MFIDKDTKKIILADNDWNITPPDDSYLLVRIPGNLYNIMCGVNKLADILVRILNLDCYDNKGKGKYCVQRFRDIYLSSNWTIVLYTRSGGANDNTPGNIYSHPCLLRSWSSELDSSYYYYEFKIPVEYEGILADAPIGVDPAYKFGEAMRNLGNGKIPKEAEEAMMPFFKLLEEILKR